jgi:glucosamine-phosphate N-acetyltransferase
VLTTVGDISEAAWNERYDWMNKRNDSYYLLVITEGEKIVGTGALVVERKFIHNLGLVGHIEDIAVAKDQQGKKLGLKIIQALDYVAENVGCYKVCYLSLKMVFGTVMRWRTHRELMLVYHVVYSGLL